VNYVGSSMRNHKYKLLTFAALSGSGYYVYRKYLKENIQLLRELYTHMKDMENGTGNGQINKSTADKVNKFLDGAGANNLVCKILEEVNANLLQEFQLDSLYEKIQNTSDKGEKQQLWVHFKNLRLLEFYGSIFVTRMLIIITQTEFSVIEKMKIQNENSTVNAYYDIYNSLLIELWSMSKSYIRHVLSEMDSKLGDILNKDWILTGKFSFKSFITIIEKIRNRMEFVVLDSSNNDFYLNTTKFFFTEVGRKIEELEKNEFSPGHEAIKTEIHLEFYNNFFDIITSNIFQTVLVNGLDYDFKIIYDLIELNYSVAKENNISISSDEISVPKICTALGKIKTNVMDKNNTIFLMKNYKSCSFNEEMKEFLGIIY